jgi:hypothetical protein
MNMRDTSPGLQIVDLRQLRLRDGGAELAEPVERGLAHARLRHIDRHRVMIDGALHERHLELRGRGVAGRPRGGRGRRSDCDGDERRREQERRCAAGEPPRDVIHSVPFGSRDEPVRSPYSP